MLKLVRVLDVMGMVFKEFPEEIFQLVNLCYLAFSCTSDLRSLPIGISRLRNLQTLTCKKEMLISLPSEIWEMSELRHLNLATSMKVGKGWKFRFVHKKLRTIELVLLTSKMIRKGFNETIPNIISLSIYYDDSPDTEVDLKSLHKLEILGCQSEWNSIGHRFLNKLRFPCNIRELYLTECAVSQSFLTTLCALPNLELLKIYDCLFEIDKESEEREWEVTEGDVFHSLQSLHLNVLNIVHWRANETNFPILRELYVMGCDELEEIPSDIGNIPTLQHIYVSEYDASVVASVQQIQKVQQEEYDNYDLKIANCVFETDGEAEEEEWEEKEGDEFRSLQFLHLQSLNILRWRANETNFPKLWELHVIDCKELEEIPCDIGDIPTLQVIGIRRCGASIVASAQRIKEVQEEEYDNYNTS